MFKETYKNIYDQITPSRQLISTVLDSEHISQKTLTTFKPAFLKPALISIAIAFCLLFAAPALAANIPVAYELMYHVSPSIAQYFKLVQKSCKNNGIKMEVISTFIHGGTAELYISMQDLTGDRIDATTDLFGSYSIHRPFNSSVTCQQCQQVGFDEATNTVTFLISITEGGDSEISGEKITFSVNRFLSGRRVYDGIPITFDIANIPVNPNTMPLSDMHGGGGDYDYKNLGNPNVLVPSSNIDFGVDEITISAIGFVDDMLHIQTKTGDYLNSDNHGYFYFINKEGINYTQQLYRYSISINEIENGERVRYTEFVFNIPPSELANYDVYGYFVSGGAFTDGPWQVTVPLEN